MNNIAIVGFKEATITRDFYHLISADHNVEILDPNEFLAGARPAHCKFLISVTRDKVLRQSLIQYVDQHSLPRATYIHPTAVVASNAVIGDGSFIAPFVSVFDCASIAKDCIFGPYAMLSHNSSIGQGSIVHPGVMIAGSTQIGRYCLLGIRSTVLDKLKICDDVVIGAGSLVTKNILIPGNYVGSPARRAMS
jgi:sugar O-acyltransferase (sialic acid O-acetyltransferase NeuD family)